MDGDPYRSAQAEPPGDPPPRPRRFPFLVKLLALAGIAFFTFCFLLSFTRGIPNRGATRRTRCASNLHQITLALHAYAQINHTYPPAYTVDANGQRLHSWRTLILPHMEEGALYAQIDLSKSWDDPVNAAARAKCPRLYRCPSATFPEDRTSYLAIVTQESWLHASEPRPIANPTPADGRTLLLIEADAKHSVNWMSPFDADEELLMTLGQGDDAVHGGGRQAAFVDGRVTFMSGDISPDERRRLIRGEQE